MRICIVSHEFEPFPGGGIATYHGAAARTLADAGHEVHFVTNAALHGSDEKRYAKVVHREGNLTVHRLPHFDEGRKIATDADLFGLRPAAWRSHASAWAVDASTVAAAQAAGYVRDLHARVGLDVVESPEFFAEAYFMIRARRSGRLGDFPPICVHGHTSSRLAYRVNSHYWELGSHPHRAMMAREEYCLQQADALLAPSRSLLTLYEREFGKSLPRTRAVIPYFLDLPRSDRLVKLPDTIADGTPFLLCVGRLEPRKGSDLAVRAFAELGRRHPDLRLVFLGREMWHHGEHFDDVLRTFLPPELRRRVVRTGNLPREQVMACMAAATVFLHPAPWDNYPCATLEAMSAGAVCIVSDRGGQAEMIEPGVSGLLHRSEDVADLVAVIRSVLDGTIDAAAMRESARRRAATVTDKQTLLQQRQTLWDEMARTVAASTRHPSRTAKSAIPGATALVGKGIVVIDAAGAARDRYERTRDALQARMPLGSGWRVEVITDPGSALTTPTGWTVSTTMEPMPWASVAADHLVVWLMSGVEFDAAGLAELVRLAQASPGDTGSFAWLRCVAGATFPWLPDFGSVDVLVAGRPLPPAVAVRAARLRDCRSLSGLGSAPARLAALLGCAVATSRGWFRHTAGPVGRFPDEPPVVTPDLQSRALGFLDAVAALSSGVTMVGAADPASPAPPAPPASTLPRWMPPIGDAAASGAVVAASSGSARAVGVANRGELSTALACGATAVAWSLSADNWFELPFAARACAEAGACMAIEVATGEGSLAEAPEADIVAVYQSIRDWWPILSGAKRPASLHAEAYNTLASQLRDLVLWRADCSLRGVPDGTRPLALPDVAHASLGSDAEALQLLRSFFAATESPSFVTFLAALAGRDDLAALAESRAWIRLALLHRSWSTWDPRQHDVLHALYAAPESRRTLVSAEAHLCELTGMRWWWDSVWAKLGLERAFERRAPFVVPNKPRRKANKPRITVLIPAYRHEKYVAEAIRSVLAQTMTGVMVLVVDDRSPDGTVAAARSVADDRVVVVENESNKGLGNSILDAMELVSTPYVAILNSDDVFHPRRLETCVAAMASDSSIDLVCTGLHLLDRDGGGIDGNTVSAWHDGRNVHDWVHWYERTRPADDDKLDTFRELLRRNFLVTSSNVVCRTDWLRAQSVTLRGLKYCLDWQLFLTAAMRCRLRYVAEPLLAYRLHPGNTVWFDREARWAYTVEVSRVAASAIREHRHTYPAHSEQAVTEVLQDLLLGMRENTEVDWRGMLANELIGGEWLEAAARSEGGVARMLRDLLGTGPAGATDARTIQALESKARAQLDTIHQLRARQVWMSERIAASDVELAELRHAVGRATDEARELRQALSRTAMDGAAELARAHELAQTHAAAAEEFGRRLANAQRTVDNLESERLGLQAARAQAQDHIAALAAEVARMGDEAATLREHVHRMGDELSAQAGDLDAMRRQMNEATKRERSLAARGEQLARDVEEARSEATSLRQEVARLSADGVSLRADRAELQSERGSLRQEVARLEADGVSLRAGLAALRREVANLVDMLGRDGRVRAAERDRAQQAWSDGAVVRSALAIGWAEESAQRARDDAATWVFRGIRVRPGHATRSFLRCVTRWARRLRSPLVAGPGVDLGSHVDFVYLADPDSDPSAVGEGTAFAECKLLRVRAVDGNSSPPVEPGCAALHLFPERSHGLLARMARVRGIDADEFAGHVRQSAEGLRRHFALALAEVVQSAAQLSARPLAGLLTSGRAAWQVCAGMAARLAGRPWVAIVDEVAVVDAGPAWAAGLSGADLVVARSRAIADRLLAGGVDAARLVVDLPVWTDGLFHGQRDPNLVVAFGEFESPWVWDYCVSGFAIGAASSQRLRLVGTVRPDSPASTAAESVARHFARRWPGRVTVNAFQVGDQALRRAFDGDAPHALVWIPPDKHRLAAPGPVVLGAIAAGLSILPVEGPTTTSLFGALGLGTWIPRTGILDCADVFRRACSGSMPASRDVEMIAAGLRPVLAEAVSAAARERVAAIVQRCADG